MPVVQLICAFLGSVVFSMVFNVNRRHLLSAGIGGFLGWAVYLGMGILTGSEFFGCLGLVSTDGENLLFSPLTRNNYDDPYAVSGKISGQPA